MKTRPPEPRPGPASNDEAEQAIEHAFAELEEAGPEAALEAARRIPQDHPLRHVVEAAAWQDMGELAAARRAIENARALGLDPDDADLLWTEGQLLLREWRIPEARDCFETLARADRSAAVLERLALCAQLLGDDSKGAKLLTEAARADREFPPVPRLSRGAFARVVDEAIALLPEPFRDALGQTRVVLEDVPSRALAFEGDPHEIEPETLGLFTGRSLLEQQHDDAPGPPPTIHLFQRNLERASADENELREEIRVTLYHELGHYLGFDEDGVDRMGLG